MSAVKDPSPPLPVRPVIPIEGDTADEVDQGYENPAAADVAVEKGDAHFDTDDLICGPCAEDDSVVGPRCLPCPKAPRKEEIEAHNTTHLPYRNLCPWCVAGRRNKYARFYAFVLWAIPPSTCYFQTQESNFYLDYVLVWSTSRVPRVSISVQ